MLIGVPKEIKNHEYRIGMTPAGVRELVARGHQVMVQTDGGAGTQMVSVSLPTISRVHSIAPVDVRPTDTRPVQAR